MAATIAPPPIVYTIPVLVDSKINLENSGVLIPDGMLAKVAGDSSFKIGQGDKTWNELEFVSSENESAVKIATLSKAGLVKPDGTTITVDTDGTLKLLKIEPTRTLSAPVVSISVQTVLAGDPIELTITEGPINITEVSKYLIYVNDSLVASVNATDGKANYTLTAPSAGGTLDLTIYAEDIFGNRSTAASNQVTVIASVVNSPIITSPTNNATGISRKPTITWSTFSDTAGIDTKTAAQVQVSTSNSFTSTVYDSGESTTLDTSYSLTNNLGFNTTYYIRVRYKGATLGWGPWSSVTKFTTVSNQAPTGTITVTGATTIVEQSTGNTLNFSGVTDPEGEAVTYSISQSGSATLTFSKTSNIASGTNITFTAPSIPTSTASVAVTINVSSKDSYGNAGPSKSFIITVLNKAPTGAIAVTGTTSVNEKSTGNTLSFSGVTDPKGGTITYSLTQSGSTSLTFSKTSNIASGTNITFTAPEVTANTNITVNVTSQDSYGNAGPSKSFTITVLNNKAPTGTITVTGSTSVNKSSTGNTLSFSGVTDADGDTVTYSLTQSGTASLTFSKTTGIASGTNITFSAPNVSSNTNITVTVTAKDSFGNTGPSKSFTVTVVNKAPTGIITVTGSTTVFEKSTGNTLSFSGVTDPEGDTVTYSLTQQSGKPSFTFSKTTGIVSGTNVTFTAPEVTANTTILVTAASFDSNGNAGPTKDFLVTVKAVTITKPSITSPTANSTVSMVDGSLTLVSSSFASTDSQATHKTSDWKVTTDTAGNTIKASVTASTDKTSHKFTKLSVEEGDVLYCWVKHNSSNYGSSDWSSGVKIIASLATEGPSGRSFYRHSSGKGTVMKYNDGSAKKILVLDAAYRILDTSFTTHEVDVSQLNNYTTNPGSNTTIGYYLNSSNIQNGTATPTSAKTITDTWINANVTKDGRTALANCNLWMTQNGVKHSENIDVDQDHIYTVYVYAVSKCRSVLVNGTGCNVPNIQQLARIYCDALLLDSMDPTASANPTKKLWGGLWQSGKDTIVWSSTKYSSTDNWVIWQSGYINRKPRTFGYGVIPILEL